MASFLHTRYPIKLYTLKEILNRKSNHHSIVKWVAVTPKARNTGETKLDH